MDKKVLLIADDDKINRRIIKQFLKDSYEVKEVADGKAALEFIKSNHVDILLLDIIMPGIDGFQVLKQVRENKSLDNVGILVETSSKDKTERMVLSLGADDIVSKPYDPIVIKKRLENILTVKEINRQKEMLENNDIEGLIKRRIDNLFLKIETVSEKIGNCAEIITDNSSNDRLVVKMAEEITELSESMVRILSGEV